MSRQHQLDTEHLQRLSDPSDFGSAQQGRSTHRIASSSDVDALIKSLVPDNLTPNKRAVIEQMITVWLAKVQVNKDKF
ncbi:hypothetical protein H6F43_16385 [Leptolyngbya sp. FACHB-36]|uniref:hypothetical protein n=1 Tax=Leptolyngbya sp. FACHB-36 TaxID=2692808 RepID=UPI001680CB77|nr:hypothetical protein [Leptolyngbya sp. FACHB-36]MBD2021759.1 hypothetical protein [Leptolyngbya sp. FACHB-36]